MASRICILMHLHFLLFLSEPLGFALHLYSLQFEYKLGSLKKKCILM